MAAQFARLPALLLILAIAGMFIGSAAAAGVASGGLDSSTRHVLLAPTSLGSVGRTAAPSLPSGPHPSVGLAGSVFDTVVLPNGTSVTGNFGAVGATVPQWDVYDSVTGDLFFVANNSNMVVVWSPSDHQIVKRILIPGYSPYLTGLILDPTDSRLFAINDERDNLSIINTSSLNITGFAGAGQNPYGGAWDPVNDRLYVADLGNDQVDVLNAATGASIGSFEVGGEPQGVAYDPNNGSILVGNTGGDNVTVYNLTQGKVTGQLIAGSDPGSLAVDATDNLVIVANQYSANVTLFDAQTLRQIGSIPTGAEPVWVNITPNGHAYVSNKQSDNITVLDDEGTPSWLATLPGGNVPWGGAYDPADGDEYVPNDGSNNLTVIADASTTTVANDLLGVAPTAVAYDATHDVYYVADSTNQLLLVNATTHAVMGALGLPFIPGHLLDVPSLDELWMDGRNTTYVDVTAELNESTMVLSHQLDTGGVGPMAFDPVQDVIVLANSHGNLTLIDPATVVGTASISLPMPGGYPLQASSILWDPATAEVYLTGGITNNSLTVVNIGSSSVVDAIPTGFDPQGEVLDLATGNIYVTNAGSANLTVVDPTTDVPTFSSPTGLGPNGIVYDSSNGYLYVANENSNNVSVLSPGTVAPITSLAVGVDPDGIAYASDIGNVSVANEDNGTLSLIGAPGTPPPEYSVTFASSPTSCSLTFDGTVYSNGEVDANVVAGTYPIVAPSCSGEVFSEWESSVGGVTTASAAATNVNVDATGTLTASFVSAGSTYQVAVVTSPTSCDIQIDGTTYGDGQTADGVTAGTHTISAPSCPGETFSSWATTAGSLGSPSSADTSLQVTADATLTATFTTTPTYQVDFAESGLPVGTGWSVLLDGVLVSSTTTSLSFVEPDGTYAYSITDVPGWHQTTLPYSGFITVSGQGVTESTLAFGAFTYSIAIAESGLPQGTSWSVTLNGVLQTVSVTMMYFYEPNGTYSYTVGTVSGFSSQPPSGSLSVVGAALSQSISFLVIPPPPPVGGAPAHPAFLGLPGDDGYALVGVLALIGAIGIGLFLLRGGRPGGHGSGSPPVAPPPPYVPMGPSPGGGSTGTGSFAGSKTGGSSGLTSFTIGAGSPGEPPATGGSLAGAKSGGGGGSLAGSKSRGVPGLGSYTLGGSATGGSLAGSKSGGSVAGSPPSSGTGGVPSSEPGATTSGGPPAQPTPPSSDPPAATGTSTPVTRSKSPLPPSDEDPPASGGS
ncbi:MAG: hypothetical protein L3K03_08740 [Thermoplasmata archaeon]|nr:hypothetical protein [Thermoplasmata archaeon]